MEIMDIFLIKQKMARIVRVEVTFAALSYYSCISLLLSRQTCLKSSNFFSFKVLTSKFQQF